MRKLIGHTIVFNLVNVWFLIRHYIMELILICVFNDFSKPSHHRLISLWLSIVSSNHGERPLR
ncbi:MAG: hypothetical protein OXC64_07190, partial [Flavobacteriaceae bacterium]|nr:hypothetical protein [Flavobacteriaceae bacterium]